MYSRAETAERLVAPSMAVLVVLAAVGGVVVGGSLPASAASETSAVEGTPHLNASAPDARFTPGEDGAVAISVTNDATYDHGNETHPQEATDRAGEARSVTLDVSDTRDAPIAVETGEQAIGTIEDGETSGPHTFDVVVDEDADAGTYEVEVTTRYRHAERVAYEEVGDGEYEYNETVVSRTETDTITVVVEPEAQFELVDVRHDVPLGGEGTVAVDLENAGDENVTESTVSLTSGDSDLYFGSGTATSEANVGRWDAGETKTLRYRAGTVDSAVEREYPIDVAVAYTDSDDARQQANEQFGLTPRDRTDFRIAKVDHDVPRDGEGTMTVTVENAAEKTIEDVSVTARTSDSDVYVGSEGSRSSTTYVDDWRSSRLERFTFRVGTTGDAVEREYPIELEFDYTDADDNDNSRTEFVEFTPEDRDHLDVEVVEHNVPRDGEGTLTVSVENDGDRTLTDVAATLSTTDSEIYVGSESSRSAGATIEELDDGDERELTFRVGATGNAVDRPYPLDLRLEYADEEDNENERTERLEFRPRSEPQFLVEDVDHDVPVGSTGEVTVTLRNDGPVNATETVVTASSDADALFFGTGGAEPIEVEGVAVEPPQTGTPAAQTYVGDWPVNETRTVTFRAGFDEDVIDRDYVATLAFDFENDDGDGMPSRTRTVGIRPAPEQEFRYEALESDLYVGEEGDLVTRVTNVRNRTVDGVVVVAETQAENVNFYNGRYAVGELGPDESATVTHRVGVTEEAEDGPRVFEFSTRYRDSHDEVRRTDSRDVTVDVAPSRDEFALETDGRTYAPGDSGPFRVTVTNRRDETLTNVQAKLFTDDPLDSEDDSAFIRELEPDESETITLDLSVGETATEKTYSVSMDFRYDDERGDTSLSDTYRVPVAVEESDSRIDVSAVLAVLSVVVAVGVGSWRVGALEPLRERAAAYGIAERLPAFDGVRERWERLSDRLRDR